MKAHELTAAAGITLHDDEYGMEDEAILPAQIGFYPVGLQQCLAEQTGSCNRRQKTENGTPEQIFDHPQQEQTRRFIRKLKVLEFLVESRESDFEDAGNNIDQYCLRSNIPPRIKYRVHLVFEELVQQILLPVLNRTAIHVSMEYSEEQETATVTIAYGGDRYDPAAGKNDLAYTVLKRSINELTYHYTEGAELSNTVCAVIRH